MSTVDRLEILKEKLTEEKNAYNRMYNMYAELQERIDKAIEYIEKADSETNDMYEMCESSKNYLLSILRGEDKE